MPRPLLSLPPRHNDCFVRVVDRELLLFTTVIFPLHKDLGVPEETRGGRYRSCRSSVKEKEEMKRNPRFPGEKLDRVPPSLLFPTVQVYRVV